MIARCYRVDSQGGFKPEALGLIPYDCQLLFFLSYTLSLQGHLESIVNGD